MPPKAETFFIQAPWSDGDDAPPGFERGIYVPFASEIEALRQAAWDLQGAEKSVQRIFKAKYGDHYDDDKIQVVHDYKSIKSQAKALQDQINEEQKIAEAEALAELHKAVREGSAFKNTVPGNAYSIMSGGTATGGAIALAAATAKTVIGLAAGAANQPSIVEVAISFDGVTASNVPVLCEWVSGTNATNPPGTASTSVTPKQIRGWPAQASQQTAAYAWTTEPTVLEVFKKRLLTPNGGLIVIQSPLGREHTGIVTASTQFKFIGLRLTAPAIVNTHVDLEFEE